MPLKIGSTTISNVFLGSTQIAKVLLALEKTWENLVNTSTTKSYSWYTRRETSGGGRSSEFTINDCVYPYQVTAGSCQHSSCQYYLDGKVNSSDSYTRLATGNGFNVTLTGKTQYKYFRFGATDYTYSKWIDPAGMYYWCEGSCNIYYKKKGS